MLHNLIETLDSTGTLLLEGVVISSRHNSYHSYSIHTSEKAKLLWDRERE